MTIRNCNQGLDGRSVSAHAGGCTILRAMLAERIVKRGGCLALLFVLAVGPLTSAANKPNIILVTLESVRADRMGFLGAKSRTPNLAALAKQSVIFERAYAQAPLTVVSHATILSEEASAINYAFETTIATALSCAYPLHRHASEALRDAYLEPILDGRAVGAICVTEPGTGSDSIAALMFMMQAFT